MRTLLQALKELVREDALVHRHSGSIVLREEAENSTCGDTTLQRPGRTLVLRPQPWPIRPWPDRPPYAIPTNQWLFPLFRANLDDPPVCRSCDYLIFHAPQRDEEHLFVFLCELKSGRPRGAADQLRNAKLLVDYMLAVTYLHGRVPNRPRIKIRGVTFAGSAPPQKGSTHGPGGAHYEADGRLPDLMTTIQRAGETYELAWFCN